MRRSIARFLMVIALVATAGAFGGVAAAMNQATPEASPVASPTAPPAQIDYGAAPSSPVAWVELGPDGAQIARAITGASGCPHLTVDGKAQAMQSRVAPDASFPVTICEATIPQGAKQASVAEAQLHLLSGTPKRVAVIGDTGCRLEKPNAYQGCDDPSLWPFASIARQLAGWRPDLIIHVGDYYYREDPCPAGDATCAGSPTGDTWASWNAGFFTPAAPLLPAAPWDFVRGNHETCKRGGNGWFHFLDPRPMPAACQTYTDPYAVPVGDVQLLVFDSSAASDGSASPDQVAEYTKELDAMAKVAGNKAWFLTHRPVWGAVQFGADRTLATGNATLQAATGNTLPGSGRPPVFIAGNTGTELDAPVNVEIPGLDIGGVPVASGRTVSAFGYMTMESTSGVWTTARNVDGAPFWSCAVLGKTAACAP